MLNDRKKNINVKQLLNINANFVRNAIFATLYGMKLKEQPNT